MQVSDAELAAALTTLWLQIPLRVSTAQSPLYVGRTLALASTPVRGGGWRSELARSYGQFCEQCGTPGDCLTLLDDGPHLQADDKRDIALALAVGPALEGVDAEMKAMVHPTRVLATLSFTITAYMALLLAPEPVTKGVALAFSVLMWGYLGWEFFDLLRAYRSFTTMRRELRPSRSCARWVNASEESLAPTACESSSWWRRRRSVKRRRSCRKVQAAGIRTSLSRGRAEHRAKLDGCGHGSGAGSLSR